MLVCNYDPCGEEIPPEEVRLGWDGEHYHGECWSAKQNR